MNYIAVAVGGSLGALMRYAASQYMTALPAYWSTALVNVVGSLLMGILWVLVERHIANESMRLLLGVGLLGSLTTFSTFSLDIILLINQSQWVNAILYILVSLILSLGVMIGAIILTKQLLQVIH